jgi:hypothetical protein
MATATVRPELQRLADDALVAFHRAHPGCEPPAIHFEEPDLGEDIVHLHDRPSADSGWFRAFRVPGRASVIRLSRCTPPEASAYRAFETHDVNVEVAEAPAPPSPLVPLRRATDALVTTGDRLSRYVTKPRPDLVHLDTLGVVIREACTMVLPFRDAQRDLATALQETLPTLERLREEARGSDVIRPTTPLSKLQSHAAGPTPSTALDHLEEVHREAKAAHGIAADAWPTIQTRLQDDLAACTVALPRLIATEREQVKAQIAEAIVMVETQALRGRVVGLDRLGELTHVERDLRVVLQQIQDALA